MLSRKQNEESRDKHRNKENSSGEAGMCATCVLVKDCVLSHQENNLYACDEYQQANSQSKQGDYQKELQSVERLGLCATCSEKKHCYHKSIPGGVWHCEEYQ